MFSLLTEEQRKLLRGIYRNNKNDYTVDEMIKMATFYFILDETCASVIKRWAKIDCLN